MHDEEDQIRLLSVLHVNYTMAGVRFWPRAEKVAGSGNWYPLKRSE